MTMIMMQKFLMCVVLVAAVAAEGANKYHPKFRNIVEDFVSQVPKKEICTAVSATRRDEIIEESRCGEPKKVFEYLTLKSAHELISPRAVWVKRCVGLCDYDNEGSCIPTETVTRHIPVRIYNSKTNKEACATYPVVEHVSCGCCALSPEDCPAPQVFNPRKCACQCPNPQERRDCLKQRNQNMRWNRSKCACEPRKRKV